MGCYKGVPKTEEHRRHMSEAQKGNKNHMFGKHPSDETRLKLSIAQKGKVVSSEARLHLSQALKGHKLSDETKMKIGQANKGRHPSQETKEKNRLASLKNQLNPEYREKVIAGLKLKWQDPVFHQKMVNLHSRWKHTDKTKAHLRIAIKQSWDKPEIKKARSGENNPAWLGGISYLPYSPEFTQDLKEQIRTRDNYTCQICGKPQNGIPLAVHHIDYVKENCDPTNLISLCAGNKGEHSCHAKTNVNRKYWQKRLTKLIRTKQMVMRL